METTIHESWKEQLRSELEKAYFATLMHFVEEEYRTKQIFPPRNALFRAFEQTPFSSVKVVILGQDPYHNEQQADGLAFSVNDGVRIPPSLINIFKEIKRDVGIEMSSSGNLSHWANQGVLLLNATLTVEAHKPASHQKKGWETFTDAAIRILSQEREHIVFLLWGAYAQKKAMLIDRQKHLVLTSAHPSPLSVYRGFAGNNHFGDANTYLEEKGIEPISW